MRHRETRRRVGKTGRCAIAAFTAALAIASAAPLRGDSASGEEDPDLEILKEATLEDLMATRVTSLAGVEEGWFQTPAAMYVISNEDVRRSGHRTLAEAMRLAPGVFVGRRGSHAWVVGTRGFNGGLANKTLVLIDGRSVYDPLFGGTLWDAQDVLLEDLDRIEVIRGPGPTLWGANAVNGVFNVVTKSARHTQGLYVGAGVGTHERGFGEARYGGRISDDAWYRVYGKYFNRDELELPGPTDNQDDWSMLRSGFRIDGEGGDDAFYTLQGDIYDAPTLGESLNVPVPNAHLLFRRSTGDGRASGGNLLMRFGQDRRERGWSVQAYYDRTDRVASGGFEIGRDTGDIEFRHHFNVAERHQIVWGLAGRYHSDQIESGPTAVFEDGGRDFGTVSAFVQDTITLVPDRVFAMAGSKFEVNSFTGFEVQPSARLWWTPGERHTLWGAITRAVRVPSRTEEDGTVVAAFGDEGLLGGGAATGVVVPVGVFGNDDLDAEELVAYEAGYRIKPLDRVTLDTTVFFNDYRRLISVPPGVLGTWNNNGAGESYGAEFNAKWQVAPNWRLEASYSFVRVQVHGPVEPFDETFTPYHQAHVRSYVDVTRDLEFNSALYYVDRMVGNGRVDPYLRLDLGVTWHVTPNFDLTVWGQNLLDPQHPEFGAPEVERGVYMMGTVRF